MRRRAVLGAALLAVATLVPACTTSTGSATPSPTAVGTQAPGFNLATGEIVRASEADAPVGGGTLRVATAGRCPIGRPALVATTWCANVNRAVTRQLVAYSSMPGRQGSIVVADLAESLGVPSADFMTWTYRLRAGVRWEDGTPITSEQAAAGVRELDARTPALTVTRIDVSDARTLVIQLATPIHALDALLARPIASPRGDHGASGPFRIGSVDAGTTTLVRNETWDEATDPIRRPQVDRIEIVDAGTAQRANARLLRGAADVALPGHLDAEQAGIVLADARLAVDTDNPGTGRMVFLALPGREGTSWQAATCRQAIYSAVDRIALAKVFGGGDSLHADVANAVSPATIVSFDRGYTPFLVGDGTGDVDAATAVLGACGAGAQPQLRVAYEDSELGASLFDVLRTSVGRAGIRVVGLPVPAKKYRSFVQTPLAVQTAGVDAMIVVQTPAVPGVWGFWQPLVDGSLADDVRTTNIAQIDLPTIDALLTSPEISSPDPYVQANVGRMIDRIVLDTGKIIPLAYAKSVIHRPARLTNVTTNGALGNDYDLVNIGVGHQAG